MEGGVSVPEDVVYRVKAQAPEAKHKEGTVILVVRGNKLGEMT